MKKKFRLEYRLEDIPPEGLGVDLEIPEDQAAERMSEAGGVTVQLAGPISGRLELSEVGSRYVVQGRVRSALKVECARCLEEVLAPVDEEVLVVYIRHPEGDLSEEIDAESANQEFIENEEIDLWPAIEEQLVLAVPIKALCREDCKGICPNCGGNRNKGECNCPETGGRSAFADLGVLRDKLPKRE